MLVAIVFYAALVLGSLALVFVGLDTVAEGFERFEERTVVEDWPVSSTDAVALGRTAIAGRARPDPDSGVKTVPFGNREAAVLYEVTVTDTNKSDGSHVDERVAPPFRLETEDGSVRVDASSLRLDLTEDREWSREVLSHEEIPPRLEAFAEERDLPAQGLDRDREFASRYLAPGDEVFVYGRAVPDEARESLDGTEKAVLVTAHEDEGGFLSNKSRETLLAERRGSLVRNLCVGVVESVVGLALFLWFTGIAQFFLGA